MERYRVRASFTNSNSNSNGTLSSPRPPFSTTKPPLPSPHRPSVDADAAEISIFDAERYFSDLNHPHHSLALLNTTTAATDQSCCSGGLSTTNPRDSSVSSFDGAAFPPRRSRSFRATPTASSEASWNSQSGLLSHPPGSKSLTVRPTFPSITTKPSSNSPRRRFFSLNSSCPCYGKKSVDVEPPNTPPPIRTSHFHPILIPPLPPIEVAKLKISDGIWPKDNTTQRIRNSGGAFSFPVLLPPLSKNLLEDPARDSLEVFRPPDDIAFPKKSAAADDDVASDTSSDLFEIESFSTQMTSYRRRDSLDEFDPRRMVGGGGAGILQLRRSLEEAAASIAQSECYAPSEVSVEWSVTTAEGGFDRSSVANFSSAASDYEEVRFIQAEHDRFGSAMEAEGRKKGGGGGGLLSCRCEKAVSVGPNPIRLVNEPRRAGASVFAVEPDHVARSCSARVSRPVQTR